MNDSLSPHFSLRYAALRGLPVFVRLGRQSIQFGLELRNLYPKGVKLNPPLLVAVRTQKPPFDSCSLPHLEMPSISTKDSLVSS